MSKRKQATGMTLAERLNFVRLLRGLGSRELDKAAGLVAGHVAVIESRKNRAIESTTASGLAKALDVTLDWLLTGEGPGPVETDADRARNLARAQEGLARLAAGDR